jgi:hypothetical protein
MARVLAGTISHHLTQYSAPLTLILFHTKINDIHTTIFITIISLIPIHFLPHNKRVENAFNYGDNQ